VSAEVNNNILPQSNIKYLSVKEAQK